jgi:hypothetical protein
LGFWHGATKSILSGVKKAKISLPSPKTEFKAQNYTPKKLRLKTNPIKIKNKTIPN